MIEAYLGTCGVGGGNGPALSGPGDDGGMRPRNFDWLGFQHVADMPATADFATHIGLGYKGPLRDETGPSGSSFYRQPASYSPAQRSERSPFRLAFAKPYPVGATFWLRETTIHI